MDHKAPSTLGLGPDRLPAACRPQARDSGGLRLSPPPMPPGGHTGVLPKRGTPPPHSPQCGDTRAYRPPCRISPGTPQGRVLPPRLRCALRRETPADEIKACLKSSNVWNKITKFSLITTMRVQLYNGINNNNKMSLLA